MAPISKPPSQSKAPSVPRASLTSEGASVEVKKKSKKSVQKPSVRRRYASVSLSEAVRGAIGKEFKRRGFVLTEVVTRWPSIVGQELARVTQPEKLTFPVGKGSGGTLHLKVAPGHAPEVIHLQPLIVERVNVHFGHDCVGKLRIVQGPLVRKTEQKAKRFDPNDAPVAIREKVSQQVSGVVADDLRDTLSRIGSLVHMARGRR